MRPARATTINATPTATKPNRASIGYAGHPSAGCFWGTERVVAVVVVDMRPSLVSRQLVANLT
jgi:hypothetical protein